MHMDAEEPLQRNNRFSEGEGIPRSVLTNSNQRHCCHIERQMGSVPCDPEEFVVSLRFPPDFKESPVPFLNKRY